MSYNKTNWENLPSTNTPVNANNMNKIENELETLDNDLYSLVSNNFNTNTGKTYSSNYLNSLIKTRYFSDSITVNANSFETIMIDTTTSNYIVIGIVQIDNSSNDLVLEKFAINENTNRAFVTLKNNTNSNITSNYSIRVLYLRNS